MILRDTKLEPRSPTNEYWVETRIALVDGRELLIERPTAANDNSTYSHDRWWMIVRAGESNVIEYDDMDEFEAQMILDHYAFNIGIKP